MTVPTVVPRERLSFNSSFRFHRGDPPDAGTRLAYAELRPWVLATGADLVNAGVPRPVRPDGDPGGDESFVKTGSHLALADIQESIRELRHYRAHLLAPQFART